MCRQFYRYCRDCHEPFRMTEPDMRESCDELENAQAIKPFLQRCPWEVQVIRPQSGHGAKVCEACSKRNRNEQRKRENAQKRARRAKLKRDKMTAGIGPGNVLWTPPRTRTPNFVHTQTLALHSPQSPQRKTRPRGPNILSVRSMTQAHRQYELNSGISTATMPQRHVNISQLECEAYLESRQLFTPMTPSALRPQEHGYDNITTEFRNETQMHRQYNRIVPQYLPTPKPDVSLPTPKPDGHLPKTVPEVSSLPPPLPKDLDVPLYQEQQHSPVGLGIFLPKDTKHEQTPTQTSFFDEWKFRMELTEWSTVFEDDDDPDDAKEL